ncbi:MAG: carbamoyltransferase HypF [Phycisphaerae bacterium]|nr:carbamoyltransferase HypF [Phycisphaerae bacterium]
MNRIRVTICGRVQGVGCRPFIYCLAAELGLSGTVQNDTQGVTIEAQSSDERLDEFVTKLCDRTQVGYPALMEVWECGQETIPVIPDEDIFRIIESQRGGSPVSQVTPDCATCADCLMELNDPSDFRYRYPFINCTHCGPRYSIVKTIPYDRPNTTMGEFAMCQTCQSQYTDVQDRRFHAQPVACPVCGPKVWLTNQDGKTIETDSDKVIARCAEVLRAGGIAAIKGIGGFHLAADALNEQAVSELRRRKHRDAKPFAMMAASVEAVKKYAIVDELTTGLLTSSESPIVLLDKKKPNTIAPSVAFGTHRFGFMLCYAPLHHLLFAEEGIEVLVMTSANLSDEPLICKNEQALDELGNIADVFVMHDREIYRQVDDSVAHEVNGQAAFLRRARGYVPTPVYRNEPNEQEIFAAGPDLKNTFCFVKGNQYLMSEHIGDLADGRVYRHYVHSVQHLQQLFEVKPQVAVCDLHPGYLSTHFAEQLQNVTLVRVQHHWAHIASVLAEYNLSGPVIGLVADGTGYGTDGAIWGCECLIATLTEFERFGHLAYYSLAGGDKASKEAIRPVIGLLNAQVDEHLELLASIEPDGSKIRLICEQIEKGLNTVSTSSLGRLFDTAAALLGLGTKNRFEAELPMALESIVENEVEDAYPIELQQNGSVWCLEHEPIIQGMIGDIHSKISKGIIAARFHNSVCEGLLKLAKKARQVKGLSDVALSGGVFCNRYLANRLIRRLQGEQFRVLWKKSVPVNDGGISLGQAAIAAQLAKQGLIGK